jgi:hypothetical protein
MNFVMRTALEAIKGQVFKAVLSRLSQANQQQQAAAPVFFEKIEVLVEPYFRAFPKMVSFAITKVALAFVFVYSFFALFTEALRQIDAQGSLAPSAYLIGFFALLALSAVGFLLVKAPLIERREALIPFSPSASTGSTDNTMDDQSLPPDYSNVEHFPRPTPLSGAEVLLNELRAERASFFSSRN